jgi:hypothetical protein
MLQEEVGGANFFSSILRLSFCVPSIFLRFSKEKCCLQFSAQHFSPFVVISEILAWVTSVERILCSKHSVQYACSLEHWHDMLGSGSDKQTAQGEEKAVFTMLSSRMSMLIVLSKVFFFNFIKINPFFLEQIKSNLCAF